MKRKLAGSNWTVSALADRVAEMFPPELAESWDNVGLQIGDPARRIRRVMTCLEVTPPTLTEAKRRGADVILAHHPLIFRPMKTVLESRPAEKLATELIRAKIALIVAHTNMDSAPWGTNQVLAEACGLTPTGPLVPRSLDDGAGCPSGDQLKFVVFTPKGHERAVIDAMHRGGGGRIGLYTHCTFRSEGTGTFRGDRGSNPFIGKAGKFEEASEYRLEAVVPRSARASVLAEVLKVHPYEEPAYEFYVLSGVDLPACGLGCLAEPKQPLTLEKLISQMKRGLKLKQVRLSGLNPQSNIRSLRSKIRRAAICSGSGGSFLAQAVSRGADVFITGEINYHGGVEACLRRLVVIEVGHFESERIIAKLLARRLSEDSKIKGTGLEILYAEDELQPFDLR